jgi:hypothetical protein
VAWLSASTQLIGYSKANAAGNGYVETTYEVTQTPNKYIHMGSLPVNDQDGGTTPLSGVPAPNMVHGARDFALNSPPPRSAACGVASSTSGVNVSYLTLPKCPACFWI